MERNLFNVVKERIEYYGEENGSLQDLMVMILGNRTKEEAILNLAKLPNEELLEMSIADFEKLGLSKASAKKMFYTVAFAKKLMKTTKPRLTRIKSSDEAFDALAWLRYEKQENFVVLFLNTKNEIIGQQIVFKGTVNSAPVHPREIFREAMKRSATSIIVAHNHPSGNASPSQEDIDITEKLCRAGEVVGIPVLDHIIIGNPKSNSLKNLGYI